MYLSELPNHFRAIADMDRQDARNAVCDKDRSYRQGCAIRMDLAAQTVATAKPDPVSTDDALKSLKRACRERCYQAKVLSDCDCQHCEAFRLLGEVGELLAEPVGVPS